jgi:hypothetical protein
MMPEDQTGAWKNRFLHFLKSLFSIDDADRVFAIQTVEQCVFAVSRINVNHCTAIFYDTRMTSKMVIMPACSGCRFPATQDTGERPILAPRGIKKLAS